MPRAAVLIRLFALLLALLACGAAHASPQPQLQDMAVLVDASGALGIADVAAAEPDRFKPLPKGFLAAGYRTAAHWLRFEVEAPPGEWWLDIEPGFLDDLRLYQADPAQPSGWLERRAGDLLPFSAREVAYRGFVFKLQTPAEAPRTRYYLRVQTTSSMVVLPRVLSPADFHVGATLEFGLILAGAGILLIVAVLGTVNWWWSREPVGAWFVIFLLLTSCLFLDSTGLVAQYVFPRHPQWSSAWIGFFSATGVAAGHRMYQLLLGIGPSQRWLNALYLGSFWVTLAGAATVFSHHYAAASQFRVTWVLVMSALACYLSIGLWRKRRHGSLALLSANLFSMAGFAVTSAGLLGFLPGRMAPLHGAQIALIGTIVALYISISLGRRAEREQFRAAELQWETERAMGQRQAALLSMLGHELRTSLSVMRMAVGMQPMSAKAVASAGRAMHAMGEVIERSLQAEQIADGALKVNKLPCDLAQLAGAVVADCREPERVSLSLSARPAAVTDEKLLRLILANLLDNALKYGRADDKVTFALAERSAAGGGPAHVVFTVTNPVPAAGLPDPALLFEKYYRAPGAHGHSGSGLGLYNARALAAMLGASLLYLPGQDTVTFELTM